MSIAARAAELEGHGVRVVRVLHPDLFGRARSKQYPITDLPTVAEGVAYCTASLVESIVGVPLEGGDFPADRGFPDLLAIPDLTTIQTLPWDPTTAWVLADLEDHGEPSPLCSRGVLRRVIERLAPTGRHAIIAAEPEFYLLHPTTPPTPYSPREGMAYTAGRRADPDGVFDRIHRSLIDLGIGVTSAHREFSPGQFEINLRHAPALAGADSAFLLKEATKELAMREGLQANFMAKPFAAEEGSSLHIHVSLWDEARNVFAGDRHAVASFVAGVLDHAPAIAAFASSTVNSYKRLRPGVLAPTVASWGGDTRLAYVRIPAETGSGARVEVRGGDASSSPYLLTAAILAAGLDGLDRGEGPPDVPKSLPRTLGDAVAALESDEVLVGALGSELVRVFAAIKRDEEASYALAVTDWEWAQYGFHA